MYVLKSGDGDSPTDIYTFQVGGRPKNITKSALNEWDAAWSPDGRRIAFDGKRGYGEGGDVFTINADGSKRRRLTRDGVSVFGQWSPDGPRIAYLRGAPSGDDDIYVMNADGSGKHRLTHTKADDRSPFWSPDGREIVFSRGDLYVVNASTGAERRLTHTGDADAVPAAWAPGPKIIFTRSGGNDFGSARGIYVINADGSGAHKIAQTPPYIEPSVGGWSRTRAVVFAAGHGIVVINAAREPRTRQLTRNGSDWYPTWSPSGEQIAFVRNDAIWLVNRDGSRAHRVGPQYGGEHTDNYLLYSPGWSPHPR